VGQLAEVDVEVQRVLDETHLGRVTILLRGSLLPDTVLDVLLELDFLAGGGRLN
jgi:hypothetical protein